MLVGVRGEVSYKYTRTSTFAIAKYQVTQKFMKMLVMPKTLNDT